MAVKQLTTQTALITTVSVEIKTLTVSGRQVTKSLFCQLHEEPLVAADGTLRGVPWGHVNHHPNGCVGGREHWHIIWQYGTELRRARVDAELGFGDFAGEPADRLLTAWVREACHGRANRAVITGPEYENDIDSRALAEPVNAETKVPTWACMSKAAREAAVSDRRAAEALRRVEEPLGIFDLRFAEYLEWRDAHPTAAAVLEPAVTAGIKVGLVRGADGAFEVRIRVPRELASDLGTAVRAEEAAVRELLITKRDDAATDWMAADSTRQEALVALEAEINGWGLSWPEIKAEYDAAVRAEADRRQRHRDVRATLAQLPQLFIAT